MKTNDPPPSTEALIRKHSKARVFKHSRKGFITLEGVSRPMSDEDAVESMMRKYAK